MKAAKKKTGATTRRAKDAAVRAARVAAAVLLAALALRALGITWGLPHTYNADEPHVLNLAVSFGGGSLKPYAYKYPSLWPYALAASYGVYFLLWSAFGLRKGVADFVALYAWEPTGFYLIGRGLAAALSVAGLWLLWRAERESRDTADDGRPWAAALLAVAPALCEAARSAKPDCAMFALACAAWFFALRVQRSGERRSYWACGACAGLALSCQYTAAPLVLLPLAAHLFSARRGRAAWALQGLAAAGAAFLVGTPFALLDLGNFRQSIQDLVDLRLLEPRDKVRTLELVVGNVWSFAGAGSIAGVAASLGLGRLLARDRLRAGLFASLVLAYVALLANNPDGGWPRYLFGALPALALLGAEGLALLDRPGRPLLTALLAVTALVPGAATSFDAGLEMSRRDTRELAERWLSEHVEPGATILLDLPHASPRAAMSREQLLELARRARERGSPRARLYEGMAAKHPGGGWRVLRLARSARDLYSSPRHVEASQADAPMLDVSPGLSAVRAAGVRVVVTTGHGASPERAPELARFFAELEERAELSAAFAPEPGRLAGPVVRVWTLK